MTPSKLVIAAFALSATAAMAHGNKQTSAQTSGNQASNAAAQSADGTSGTAMQQDESSVKQAQQALNDKGFNVGTPDGIAGPKTAAAVKKFQQQQNIGASGQLDQQTLAALGIQTSPDMTLGQNTSAQSNTSTSSSTSTSPASSSTSSSPSASTASSPSTSSQASASTQSQSPSDTSSSSSYTTR
jgi:peptidoglycan hydrolase-like protein with peptidoglycan-binding domain